MAVHVSPVSTRQNAPRQSKFCDFTGGGAARALRATRAGGGARARRGRDPSLVARATICAGESPGTDRTMT